MTTEPEVRPTSRRTVVTGAVSFVSTAPVQYYDSPVSRMSQVTRLPYLEVTPDPGISGASPSTVSFLAILYPPGRHPSTVGRGGGPSHTPYFLGFLGYVPVSVKVCPVLMRRTRYKTKGSLPGSIVDRRVTLK